MRSGILLVVVLLLAGCRPASRYGPVHVGKTAGKEGEKETVLPPHYAWLPTTEMPDARIEFVPSTSTKWSGLSQFWNTWPPTPTGSATAHLGLPPLNAAAALVVAERIATIHIKVPLGLPDPTPDLPASNLPTYGKWRLGQKIFFDRLLEGETGRYSCASCHQPERGFANDWTRKQRVPRETLGLLNVVYNKHQFWDGRVQFLEEVLVRALEDERPLEERKEPKTSPESAHVWGGLVKKLALDPSYDWQFKQVFGVRQATQDTIAKALATYMRTLLVGDSLYDKAERDRLAAGEPRVTAKQFAGHLSDATLLTLGVPKAKSGSVPSQLEKGYVVFHGKGRCHVCHVGPLFTDQLFHNTGVGASENYLFNPLEGGRFAALPIGLKDKQMIGAYRTPTLRNLLRTPSYFHDGSRRTLDEVVKYYDHSIPRIEHLSPDLQAADQPQSLNLDLEEREALVLFLRALEGNPVDPVLVPALKK